MYVTFCIRAYLMLLVIAGAVFSLTSPAHAASCHLIQSTDSVPSGFGAPYNLFSSAEELLLKADCTGGGATLTAGNGEQTTYVYKQGYRWTGTEWQTLSYTGSELVADTWYRGSASTDISLSQEQLTQKNYYLAYTCLWHGQSERWKCGCADQSCSENYWQIQTFQSEDPDPPPADADPALEEPQEGAVLTQSTQTFSWIAGANVSEYYLGVGSTEQSVSQSPWGDIYAKSTGTNTSATVSNIPLTGDPIYVRLWWKRDGAWESREYSYETEASIDPTLSVEPVSVAGGDTVTVSVSNGPGNISDWVGLYKTDAVNTDITAWQYLSGRQTVPANGLTSAELVFTMPAEAGDYEFRFFRNDSTDAEDLLAASERVAVVEAETVEAPELLSPVPGSSLPGDTVTFTWSKGDDSITRYWLGVGSYMGSVEGSPFGDLFHGGTGLETSQEVSGIPTDGGIIYVRLWWLINDVWYSFIYTYDAATDEISSVTASPTSAAGGEEITVSIMDGPGNLTDWVGLYKIDTPGNYVFEDWQYLDGTKTTPAFGRTSATLTFTMPTEPGEYEFRFLRNNSERRQDRLATSETVIVSGEPVVPVMTSHKQGATLTSDTQTFSWSAGRNVEEYAIGVGTTKDSLGQQPWGDIHYSGTGKTTSQVVGDIPTDGSPVFVRLWWKKGGEWSSQTYSFMSQGNCNEPMGLEGEGFECTHHDEFKGATLDTSLWNYRLTAANPAGNKQSCERPQNVEISNDTLLIHARKEAQAVACPNGSDSQFTGGGIAYTVPTSYGYYEARMKLADAANWRSGFWPSFTPDPVFGEINLVNDIELDILEYEEEMGSAYSYNLHDWGLPQRVAINSDLYETGKNLADDFHVYGAEYAPSYVRYYFDGQLIKEVAHESGSTDVDLYTWLTMIGGDEAGLPDSTEVDYYRFYDRTTTPLPQVTFTVDRSNAAPGESVTVNVAGGPANRGDYVGLYRVGENAYQNSDYRNYLDFQYLNGTQTKPNSGRESASLTFMMPRLPGNYVFRFIADDETDIRGTSRIITVK